MEPVSDPFTVDVRRMRILRMLDQYGTVTATAEVLHLTPSAVSQQLAALARETGVPLLERRGRNVVLSGQARLLLSHADRLLAQVEHARADLAAYSDGAAGNVRAGAFASAITSLLAPAIARLSRDRPRLAVTVAEVQAPGCFSQLDAGELDLAVTVDYRGGPPPGDPRYHRTELCRDPYDAALPTGSPLAHSGTLTLADLASEPWVTAGGNGPCAEIPLAASTAAGFSPRVTHRVDDYSAALALVAADGGITLIPRLPTPAPPDGVTIRPLDGTAPTRTIYAAIRAGAEHDPRISAVLTALRAQDPFGYEGPDRAQRDQVTSGDDR